MSNPQDNTKHLMCIICSEFGTLGINPEVYNRTLTWHNAGHPEVGGVGQSPAHSRNLNIEGEIDQIFLDAVIDKYKHEILNEPQLKKDLIELVEKARADERVRLAKLPHASLPSVFLNDEAVQEALSSNKQGGK